MAKKTDINRTGDTVHVGSKFRVETSPTKGSIKLYEYKELPADRAKHHTDTHYWAIIGTFDSEEAAIAKATELCK